MAKTTNTACTNSPPVMKRTDGPLIHDAAAFIAENYGDDCFMAAIDRLASVEKGHRAIYVLSEDHACDSDLRKAIEFTLTGLKWEAESLRSILMFWCDGHEADIDRQGATEKAKNGSGGTGKPGAVAGRPSGSLSEALA